MEHRTGHFPGAAGPNLFWQAWLPDGFIGEAGAPPSPVEMEQQVVRTVQSRLSVQVVRNSQLARLSFDSTDRGLAAQVPNALADGATPEDLLGVLRAIAPQVGGPRVVAAAPELMLALGLPLDEGA